MAESAVEQQNENTQLRGYLPGILQNAAYLTFIKSDRTLYFSDRGYNRILQVHRDDKVIFGTMDPHNLMNIITGLTGKVFTEDETRSRKDVLKDVVVYIMR